MCRVAERVYGLTALQPLQSSAQPQPSDSLFFLPAPLLCRLSPIQDLLLVPQTSLPSPLHRFNSPTSLQLQTANYQVFPARIKRKRAVSLLGQGEASAPLPAALPAGRTMTSYSTDIGQGAPATSKQELQGGRSCKELESKSCGKVTTSPLLEWQKPKSQNTLSLHQAGTVSTFPSRSRHSSMFPPCTLCTQLCKAQKQTSK